MAIVEYSNPKKIKHFRNLHWLILHQAEVKEIEVSESIGDSYDCFLFVKLTNGRYFGQGFASRQVLFSWLRCRRYFNGKPLNWFGKQSVVIGNRLTRDRRIK